MLALICGTGDLPRAVAMAQDTPPLVCVLDGFPPNALNADLTFRIERLGSFLADLRARGVTDICLCGAITRPQLDPSLIDAATLPLVPRVQAAISQGDDGALRAVIDILQEAGLAVRGATEVAPSILPGAGVLTDAQPPMQARADVAEARIALAEMGRQDMGQACIVQNGRVLGREDARGTDTLLQEFASGNSAQGASDLLDQAMDGVADVLDGVADWLSGPDAPRRGGLLFKAPKPQQDRRADLPTIGPQTAKGAVAAGLSGIVIEAGGVIVLDQPTVIETLNAAGLFLWVRDP